VRRRRARRGGTAAGKAVVRAAPGAGDAPRPRSRDYEDVAYLVSRRVIAEALAAAEGPALVSDRAGRARSSRGRVAALPYWIFAEGQPGQQRASTGMPWIPRPSGPALRHWSSAAASDGRRLARAAGAAAAEAMSRQEAGCRYGGHPRRGGPSAARAEADVLGSMDLEALADWAG